MSADTPADTVAVEAQTPLSEGQVYTDSRDTDTAKPSGSQTVVFADHQTVVLEDADGKRRFEKRKQFDTARGDRWKLTSTAQPEGDEQSPSVTTPEPFISSLAVLQQSYRTSEEADPTDARADTITEAINLLSKNDTEPVDLTDVDGIGDATADNLREVGIATKLDVHAASDEFLLSLPGVGQKNLRNLRRYVA